MQGTVLESRGHVGASEYDLAIIDTMRTLSMDAVQKANSGHPGTPMALAPAAYVLWSRFLKFNPKDPNWLNRDWFILSCGHASLLQYTAMYVMGYDIGIDDIKEFRQLGSVTPGHPEHFITRGIEVTTGPLGQGLMNSVGLAMAEAHLAGVYNRIGHEIINHRTFVFCSDGDMMEGASHEAASVAGHFKLGKLVWAYDENHISIEGKTELTYTDDIAKRFEGYGWYVQDIGDNANNLEIISEAFENATGQSERPSLIIIRSHIGYGAPHKQDTKEAHGEPLGEDEVRGAKRFYGWPEDEHFFVPEEVFENRRRMVERGRGLQEKWNRAFEDYRKEYPDLATQIEDSLEYKLPEGWDEEIPRFEAKDGPMATRDAAGKVLNAIARRVPWLMGGSGDLAPSTKTLIKGEGYFEPGQYDNRNIAWGVREHVMCAASSGLALHGGLRPYAATFFIFTDYARPAIRLSALMRAPVIYVMTHDSIGLGEDGPTHQPIEQLASLRAMPGMVVIRPADANEAAWAWRAAMEYVDGPVMLVLTRQKVKTIERKNGAGAEGLLKGAYVISKESGDVPDIILIGTGSEVGLVLEAKEQLKEEGIDARVVSMPSWEFFRKQDRDYRESVLPASCRKRLAVEAGAELGWCEWVGDEGEVIGMRRFGASAPAKALFEYFGFTVENIVGKAVEMVK